MRYPFSFGDVRLRATTHCVILRDLHWFMLPRPRPLACIPESCAGRTSCIELPRPSEPAAPAVIPAAAAAAAAPPSKEGALMAAAATAALVLWSIAPCAMSDWDSVSSIFEPAAVLPLAFLVSCSRGSSWQRWPMLRFIHLVQGLSCSGQKGRAAVNIVCAPGHSEYTVQRQPQRIIATQRSAVPCRAVSRGAAQPQHDGLGRGCEGEHKGKGLTYEVACHMLWQPR